MRCIFVTRDRFPSSMYKKLEEVGRVEAYPYGESPWSTRGVPRDVLKDAARRCDALVVFIGDVVDREVLDAAERLRIVSTASVGVYHIDVEYARRKGIAVAHTPYVLVDAAADLAVGLLIAAARRIVLGDRMIREGRAAPVWGSLMGLICGGRGRASWVLATSAWPSPAGCWHSGWRWFTGAGGGSQRWSSP